MKRVRFILHGSRQIGEYTWKDKYFTEEVEVSDRAYELIGRNNPSIEFIGAEIIPEANQ